MSQNSLAIKDDLAEANISEDLRQELTLFRALKPYLGHCLTLNHDINNPLAGILGYSEFLLTDGSELSEDQRGYVNQITKCAERIRKLVENLCDHKLSLSENIDVESIVDEYKKIAKPSD